MGVDEVQILDDQLYVLPGQSRDLSGLVTSLGIVTYDAKFVEKCIEHRGGHVISSLHVGGRSALDELAEHSSGVVQGGLRSFVATVTESRETDAE